MLKGLGLFSKDGGNRKPLDRYKLWDFIMKILIFKRTP